MTLSVLCLVLAVAAYGTSALLLATGSHQAGSVREAVVSRAWLLGTGFQGLGFLLAFVARWQLPLIVVQSGVTASVAVTATAGAVLGRWRWTSRHALAIVLVVAGLGLVGASARTGPADPLGLAPAVACLVGIVLVVLALVPRAPGVLLLGTAAGVGYGASAVAARSLVADLPALLERAWPWWAAAITVGGVVAGSAALTRALVGGQVAGPVSAMYVVATVWSSLAGVAWLGDSVLRPVEAGIGVLVACAGSVLLADHGASPQDEAVGAGSSSPM